MTEINLQLPIPANVLKMLERILGIEGGFVDDPADSGGATRWGVTERVARRHKYLGRMQDLPRETALLILYSEFYLDPGYAEIYRIEPAIAEELVEFGINCGPATASLALQEGLNDLNDQGRLYSDIAEDGAAGKQTREALLAYLRHRKVEGVKILLRDINCRQHHYYSKLVRRRPKDERFFYGWVKERVVV